MDSYECLDAICMLSASSSSVSLADSIISTAADLPPPWLSVCPPLAADPPLAMLSPPDVHQQNYLSCLDVSAQNCRLSCS
ncbi:hypothetical protein NDU88_010517 [Pleurodeles waltl]|uniref:Uncharacterized protein n=1 Tax=Pleurodeles waltl TaxID=8319 RepID=A0AAV7S3I8_PLEWA|nr:hypothetical protein NDU88_010517 [Pleurodeles waltl]